MSRLALHWQILMGMLLGAGIGLSLNFMASERTTGLEQATLPTGIAHADLHDSPDLITIDITQEDGIQRRWVVDGTRRTPGSVATLKKLQSQDAQSYAIFHEHGRSWSRWVGDSAETRRLIPPHVTDGGCAADRNFIDYRCDGIRTRRTTRQHVRPDVVLLCGDQSPGDRNRTGNGQPDSTRARW